MPYDINSQQVDIENLFKQNANDLSSIKELYRKLKEMEKKISQIKYIDSKLADKLKKDYEKLKRIILDENIQVYLNNKIDETKTNLIDTINVLITQINDDLNNIENNKTNKTETKNIQQQINNLVLGAVGDGNNAEIIQARGEFSVLNERLNTMYQKYIINNIIVNSVLNNTDGWSTYGCDISADNGIMTIVGSEIYAQARNSNLNVNYNDKLYVRCGVNSGSNANVKIEIVEQYTSEEYLSLNCSSEVGIKYYSGIANITKTDIVYAMFRVINYENSNIPISVTKPLVVNLTKVFGKGLEPTLEEFEKKVDNLYFEKAYIDDIRISQLMQKVDNTKSVITKTIGNETQISWIDGNNNMKLVFKPCGVNNLPQIKDLYKNGIKMLDGNTDFISPFIIAGDSQFAGDKIESFEFTGGYHGYNGDGTGTPTARNMFYKVEGDNNKCKIIVVNNIQGFNTKKADGSGKEILQEEIIYTISPCKINVDVKLTALEWCRISTYMGLQAQNTPWDTKILICDDDTHKQWISLAYQNINGGNKTQSSCNKLILNKGNDYLEMIIDNSYGLGKLKYVSDTSPLMWCADYNKTYFNLVKDKDLTLNKNDVAYWSGKYKIYSV